MSPSDTFAAPAFYDARSCDEACDAYAKQLQFLLRSSKDSADRLYKRPAIIRSVRQLAYDVIRYIRTDEYFEEILLARAPAEDRDELVRNREVYDADDVRPSIPIRMKRGVKGRQSFHRKVLQAMFALKPGLLNTTYVQRMAAELEYAERHRIPPLFLDGFLLDVDAKQVADRVGANFIEPKYYDWVVEQLVAEADDHDVLCDVLEAYPAKVRDDVWEGIASLSSEHDLDDDDNGWD